MRLIRSWLYVPGNQERMLAKAPGLGADALLLDLEDSVPPAEKARARDLVARAVEDMASRQAGSVFVRVNGLMTGLCPEDVFGVVRPGLTGICLPKVESPRQLRDFEALLVRAEAAQGLAAGTLALVVLIESALGVVRSYAIASASRRIVAVALGAEDLALDLDLPPSATDADLASVRQVVAMCARAANVQAVDMVYSRIDDEPGLVANTRDGRRMGYWGKQVVHPRQVPVVNRLMTPTAEEVAGAAAIVAAFEGAEQAGRGAVALDGKMVDRPVAERARRLLDLAGWDEHIRGDQGPC